MVSSGKAIGQPRAAMSAAGRLAIDTWNPRGFGGICVRAALPTGLSHQSIGLLKSFLWYQLSQLFFGKIIVLVHIFVSLAHCANT